MTQKEFVDKFKLTFTSHLPEKVLKKFRIGNREKDFLWNLFGAKLVDCYEGDAARKEYNKADKLEAIEILYSGHNKVLRDEEETTPLKPEHMTAEGIDEAGLPEFYIIGKDFSWCYVITHEFDLCGPYFCYKPN